MKHTTMIFAAALMSVVSQSFSMAQTNIFPPDGNVGIGTTTPTKKLHIIGPVPADANEAQLAIVTPNGNLILLGRADAYGFLQSHNGAPLVLNPIGNNVGIGTESPTNLLHIFGGSPHDANEGQLRISARNSNFMLLGRTFEYAFVQSHNREPLALNPLGNNVGIGTTSPESPLTVSGVIESTSGGIKFPDGTIQTMAQLRGPQGPQGPRGAPGPPTHSVAVCQSGAPVNCACEGSTVTRVFGTCSVTSDTGPCSNTGPGCCTVCAP